MTDNVWKRNNQILCRWSCTLLCWKRCNRNSYL